MVEGVPRFYWSLALKKTESTTWLCLQVSKNKGLAHGLGKQLEDHKSQENTRQGRTGEMECSGQTELSSLWDHQPYSPAVLYTVTDNPGTQYQHKEENPLKIVTENY